MKLFFLFAALLATPLWGATIHRSFRTREAGVGFGTGTAGVAYPVDARIDKALDEARQKDQPYGKESTAYLTKLIKGCTVRVEWVKKDQYGRVLGVVYATVPPSCTVPPALSPAGAGKRAGSSAPAAESSGGTVLVGSGGTVKPIDINLHLVATGNAHHYSHFDKTPAYAAAESAAKEQKLGLWAAENPISPYDWRKNKRKM